MKEKKKKKKDAAKKQNNNKKEEKIRLPRNRHKNLPRQFHESNQPPNEPLKEKRGILKAPLTVTRNKQAVS